MLRRTIRYGLPGFLLLFAVVLAPADGVQTHSTNEPRRLELESARLQKGSEILFSLYQSVETDMTDGGYLQVTTDLLGVPFGPIDGTRGDGYLIAWNNRNRVVYMEITSSDVTLPGDLTVGTRVDDVLRVLGEPHFVVDGNLRYQNAENEVFGLLFVVGPGELVNRVLVFAYV